MGESFESLIGDVCKDLYKKDDCDEVLCDDFAIDVIKAKTQTKFLASYIANLEPSYCVVERDYVDRDFIEDYAYYYVNCFTPYRRHCQRIHFFKKGDVCNNKTKSCKLAGEEMLCIEKILLGQANADDVDLCRRSLGVYLGFIVIRPLPYAVYGRVCLKALPHKEKKFVTQKVYAHLLGIPLDVDTMPFQEQDSVVAVCATIALWSAFQITGRKFIHCIPSPHRITRMATHSVACEPRAFPNRRGLSDDEICHAICKVGLVPQSIDFTKLGFSVFWTEVYAYLRLGMPVILIGTIKNSKESARGDEGEENGHAITVSGYSDPERNARCFEATEVFQNRIQLVGELLGKFFCHDDRIGPFSDIDRSGALQSKDFGKEFSTLNRDEYFMVEGAIVPTYHKIRLRLIDFVEELAIFSDIIKNAVDAVRDEKYGKAGFCWDVYLSTDEGIKAEARDARSSFNSMCVKIVNLVLPKYIWVVDVYYNKERAASFFVDATDIPQRVNVLFAAFFKSEFIKLVGNAIKWAQCKKADVEANAFVREILPFFT